jgi:hypothetical protein
MSRPVPAGPATGRGRLPVPTRDRRPALAALALLLVLVGALGAALVVYRSGQRVDVLISTHEVRPGRQVTAADFTTARVSKDGGQTIPASAEPRFIGSYAAVDIPNQTLLNPVMFTPKIVPPDTVTVGVTLPQNLRPAQGIRVGDVVEVFALSSKSGSSASSTGSGTGPGATVLIPAARVTAVASGSSSSDSSDSVTISLLVSLANSAEVEGAAAQGLIAVAELPSDTKASPDLQAQP